MQKALRILCFNWPEDVHYLQIIAQLRCSSLIPVLKNTWKATSNTSSAVARQRLLLLVGIVSTEPTEIGQTQYVFKDHMYLLYRTEKYIYFTGK